MTDFKIPLTVAFNQSIKTNKELHGDKFNVGEISDGYHTFGELYDHRIQLFISLCKQMNLYNPYRDDNPFVWRVKPVDGWFLMGINDEKGKQITYHLPESKWEETEFAKTLTHKPEFDGHTSADVLERLKQL